MIKDHSFNDLNHLYLSGLSAIQLIEVLRNSGIEIFLGNRHAISVEIQVEEKQPRILHCNCGHKIRIELQKHKTPKIEKTSEVELVSIRCPLCLPSNRTEKNTQPLNENRNVA